MCVHVDAYVGDGVSTATMLNLMMMICCRLGVHQVKARGWPGARPGDIPGARPGGLPLARRLF